MNGLARRSVDAVLWGGAGTVLRIILQFVGQVCMARILGPDTYGVFAIGVLVTGLAGFLADFGLAYGLIQMRNPGRREIGFILFWQTIAGLVVAAGLVLAADWIALRFGKPEVAPVVRMLSLVCVLNAMGAVSLNLLKRDLDYRTLQVAQLLSYVLAYFLVGIPLALSGAGVSALVTSWVLQATLLLILQYGRTRHCLRPVVWHENALEMLKYGMSVLATNLTNWVVGNVDRFFAGRSLSAATMGFYAMAYNIVYTPGNALLNVLQSVTFSTGARMDGDRERLRGLFVAALGAVSLFVLPVFAGVALVSTDLVLVVYGAEWLDVAGLLVPLALAMPCFIVWGMSTPMLWNHGRIRTEFYIQLPLAAVWLVVCYVAVTRGALFLAWCVTALFALRAIILVAVAARCSGVRASRIGRGVVAGGGVTVVMVIAMLAWRMAPHPDNAGLRLALDLVIAASGWVTGFVLCARWLSPECVQLLHVFASRVPGPLGRMMTGACGRAVA